MEKNCLVTKYKSTVQDDSLLRIGEMRVKVTSVDSPNAGTQSIKIITSAPVTLEIIGDGYFTDSTLSENKGKTISANGYSLIYFSNGNFEVAILNKYALTEFNITAVGGTISNNKAINIKDLSYSDINILNVENSKSYGDISALKNMKNLTSIQAGSSQLSGDISNIKDLTLLSLLNLGNNKEITGNISAISNLTNLNSVALYNTKVTGDIANLRGLTKVTLLNLQGLTGVYGDISNLSTLIKLENLTCSKTNIHGNLSTLKTLVKLKSLRCEYCSNAYVSDFSQLNTLTNLANVYLKNIKSANGDISGLSPNLLFITLSNTPTNLSWSSRPSSSNIFAIEGSVNISDIDGMLDDMSNCVVPSNKPSSAEYSRIYINGSRTSASDAAVASLKSKGYTINVNGVTI